jgi:phosphoglycerate kinase
MTTQLSQMQGSIVLVRTNYDLPDLEHLIRIDDSLPTIKQLLNQNNKVVICTHWGRPKQNDPKLSTNQLDEILESKLGEEVLFVNQYLSFEEAKEEIENTKSRVILLENTRYDEHEKSKDPIMKQELAKEYSKLAKYFVDEAFAVSHREEATNYEIKKFLPWCNGLSHQEELKHLEELKQNPEKPFVAIMGGGKLETKLALIQKLLPKVDKIIISGMLSFTFLEAIKELKQAKECPDFLKSYIVPEYYASKVEQEFLSQAKEIIINSWSKIVLPVDFAYGDVGTQKMALDIGIDSVIKFQEVVQTAKTIFWNGPMGFYEKKPFDQGTIKLGEFISNLKNCKVVIGGGDVGSALPSSILTQFSWVSMGGGATLEYLSK